MFFYHRVPYSSIVCFSHNVSMPSSWPMPLRRARVIQTFSSRWCILITYSTRSRRIPRALSPNRALPNPRFSDYAGQVVEASEHEILFKKVLGWICAESMYLGVGEMYRITCAGSTSHSSVAQNRFRDLEVWVLTLHRPSVRLLRMLDCLANVYLAHAFVTSTVWLATRASGPPTASAGRGDLQSPCQQGRIGNLESRHAMCHNRGLLPKTRKGQRS